MTQLAAMAVMVVQLDRCKPRSGDARPHDAADDRMRGRDRRADPCRKVDPESRGQKRCDHRPDKGLRGSHAFRGDNPLGDRGHNLTACQQGARAFENDGDHDGATHRNGVRTDSRTHVVGHIVRTDVQGHVGAQRGRDDDDDRIVRLPEEQHRGNARQDHEDKGKSCRDDRTCRVPGREFEIGNPRKVAVERIEMAQIFVLM